MFLHRESPLTKRIFLVSALLITVLIGIGSYHVAHEYHDQKAYVLRDQEDVIHAMGSLVENNMRGVFLDLLTLASNTQLIRAVNTGEREDMDELVEIFLSFSREKGKYDQVRYIDASGMETVRVNYGNSAPYIVQAEELQNKFQRYYFSDTFDLDNGQIFVSPLDLNIEHGELETPFKPMIRIGTPIFDMEGNKRGIVLLNYLADDFLNVIEEKSTHPHRNLMILNSDGYWLKGASSDEEWGFMLAGRGEMKIGNTDPEAWENILNREKGNVRTSKGLYTFNTYYPLTDGMFGTTRAAEAYESSKGILKKRDYFWKFLAFIPADELNGFLLKRPSSLIALYLFSMLLLVFTARRMSQAIVQRERTEEALRESESKLSGLFSAVPIGIGLLSSDRSIKMINKEITSMLGYTKDELIGKNARILYSSNKEYVRVSRKKHADVAKYGIGHIETFWIRKNGSRIAVNLSSSSIHWNDKKSDLVFTAMDITDIKAAGKVLREREKRYRLLYENNPLPYQSLSQDGIYLEVNSAWKTLMGYDRKEIIGRQALDLVDPAYLKMVGESFLKLLQSGEINIPDIKLLKKDGTSVHIALDGKASVDEDTGQMRTHCLLRDITEINQMEDALKKSHRMAAVGQVASGIAHEINNPLATISACTEALQSRVSNIRTKRKFRMKVEDLTIFNDYLSMIEAEVAHSSGIIRDLLDFSRMRPFAKTTVDMYDMCHKTIRLMEVQSRFSKHEFNLNCECIHTVRFLGDRNRLRQVLVILLTNAAEAMPDGGRVSVSCCELRDEGVANIVISDQGPGIADTDRERIFEPFFTTKDPGKSTGLGLSIADAIVTMHGGKIVFDSTPGEGSFFEIQLPLDERGYENAEEKPEEL